MSALTTADYALVVSILSFVVSLGSLAWNVWSKYIYPKAKLRVSFAIMTVIGDSRKTDIDAIGLGITNYGPTDIKIHTTICRQRKAFSWKKLKREWQYAILNPLHDFPNRLDLSIGPFGGGLPHKLVVGESFSLYLTIDHEALREQPIIDVGVSDVFGRSHWAPRSSVRKVRRELRKRAEALPEPPQPSPSSGQLGRRRP